MANYKHVSFMATEGGHLVAGSNSADTAGGQNYVEKLNFRRESDGEVRREGWDLMSISDSADSILPDDNPVRLLYQFSSEEKEVLIAAAGRKIFRYNERLGQWVTIAENLQSLDHQSYEHPDAIRWEAVPIDGYLILNNGVDLPLFYREDWPCAFPMYSVRERGIIRVGTIAEFDGRLWMADVEYFEERVFDSWMNLADEPYGCPEVADGEVFEAISVVPEYGGSAVVNSYRVPHAIEYSAWRLASDVTESRAAPYLFGQVYDGKMIVTGSVDDITATAGSGYTTATVTITDPTSDSTHVKYNPNFPGGSGATADAVIENGSIAGITITNAGSGYREVDVSISGNASATASLGTAALVGLALEKQISSQGSLNPYFTVSPTAFNRDAASTFRTGDEVRIADEGVSEGEIVSVVTTGKKTTVTLAITTSTTPNSDGETARMILLKEPDALSADAEMQKESADTLTFPEDGSVILKMVKLADKLLVYRQTGYLAITRGNTQSAFFHEERYRGERVADFRNTIIAIDEQRHMFAGYNGVFAVTPSSIEPTPLTVFNNGPEFWRHVSSDIAERVFAFENGLTQEVMIMSPVGHEPIDGISKLNWGVIALDMVHGTLSTLDSAFTAATTVFPSDLIKVRWFLLATHIVRTRSNVPATPDPSDPGWITNATLGGDLWTSSTTDWSFWKPDDADIPEPNDRWIFLEHYASTGWIFDHPSNQWLWPARTAAGASTPNQLWFKQQGENGEWLHSSQLGGGVEGGTHPDVEPSEFPIAFLESEASPTQPTGARIMRYGYGAATTAAQGPYRSFSRAGSDYECRIRFGKTDFGDRFSEKSLRSYVLHFSDIFTLSKFALNDYVEAEYFEGPKATVSLLTSTSAPDVSVEEVTEELENLQNENMIPTFSRGNYFQDSITVSGNDVGFKFNGRTFEVSGVKTRHASEAVMHEVS